MKKWWIILIVLAVVSLFVILIVVGKKKDTRPFNHFDFPETVMVTNGTEYEKADTLIMVLANKILGMDTVDIKVYYIPVIVQEGEMEFYGMVQQLPFGEHKYLILLNKKLSLSNLKTTLSHEFTHIDQYERGDLFVYGNMYDWKEETKSFSDVKYQDRPFEKEAMKQQGKVVKELNELLYN